MSGRARPTPSITPRQFGVQVGALCVGAYLALMHLEVPTTRADTLLQQGIELVFFTTTVLLFVVFLSATMARDSGVRIEAQRLALTRRVDLLRTNLLPLWAVSVSVRVGLGLLTDTPSPAVVWALAGLVGATSLGLLPYLGWMTTMQVRLLWAPETVEDDADE